MVTSDQQHMVTRDFLELHGGGEHNNRLIDMVNPRESLLDAVMNAIPRSNIPEDVRPPPGWLYGNTHAKTQASTSNLSFPGMRRPDWLNAWQQFLSFKSSQNGRLPNNFNASYSSGYPKGCENAVVGATFSDCNPSGNPTTDGNTVVRKYFPFQAPSPREQTVTMRMQQILMAGSPCPAGQANTPAASPSAVPADVFKDTYTSDSSKKSIGAQLTIFYRGKVNVYNDVPTEKAQEIMLLAVNGSLANCEPQPLDKGSLSANDGPIAGESMPTCSTGALTLNEPVVPQALPHARKASLARFLERRKERILSKAPYLIEKSFLCEPDYKGFNALPP